MCLAVSAKVMDIKENKGFVDMDGIKIWVNLDLIEDPRVGDFLLIHSGFAIEKIDREYFDFLQGTVHQICSEET